MFSLTRRAFILAALAAPAVPVRSQETPLVPLDDFMDLSERLLERTNLDRETGQVYLNALVADRESAVALANFVQRAGNPIPEERVLAATIIEWWYTGVYERGGRRQLATHTGALMWSAMEMPAPGTCAGPFGAWARSPAGIA